MVPSKRLKLLSVRLRHSLGAQAESQMCPRVLPFSPIQFPLFWPIQSCTQPPRCLSCSRCCLQGTQQACAAPAATERQQDQPWSISFWTPGQSGWLRKASSGLQKAWSPEKNTAYPWETWQQLPVISGGNDQSESIHLTGKGQGKKKRKKTASLPKTVKRKRGEKKPKYLEWHKKWYA